MSVKVRRSPRHLAAECETCRWYRDTGNPDADRAAARRHAEKHGHRVYVESSRGTYFVGEANGA